MFQLLPPFLLVLSLMMAINVSASETNDIDAIRTTIMNYFNGLKESDENLLTKAFVTNKANMKGLIHKKGDGLVLSNREMINVISDWAKREPNPNMTGEILAIDIFSKNGATALFDFNNTYIDSFQLAKTKRGWKIINKFYVDK